MSQSTFQQLMGFDQEQALSVSGLVAGVDEAGRGPLAGPVVAAAVIFIRPSEKLLHLNDSKQVTSVRREELFYEILKTALIGIGVSDQEEIDRINIYQATRVAMRKAVLALTRTPDLVLIDGNMKIDWPLAQRSVIKGDTLSASIAAASILAKVYRDAWMQHLDTLYPDYGFAGHKGYPTPDHLNILSKKGPSPVHRKSFGPVRKSLEAIYP